MGQKVSGKMNDGTLEIHWIVLIHLDHSSFECSLSTSQLQTVLQVTTNTWEPFSFLSCAFWAKACASLRSERNPNKLLSSLTLHFYLSKIQRTGKKPSQCQLWEHTASSPWGFQKLLVQGLSLHQHTLIINCSLVLVLAGRVDFFHGSWFGAVFWICAENTIW